MQEILKKRTYTQKHYDNGDGTITMRAHAGHIHYKDELGLLQDSDIRFTELTDRWEMTKHNYQLEVAKDFSAPLLMRYRNKYEGADHTITYEPVALAWYRASDNNVQIFRNQQAVQGVLNGNSIYYTGAFGNGIDFEITLMRSGFKKEIVIPNKPNTLPTPPSANHRLVAIFKYGGTAAKVVSKEDGTEWDKDSNLESNEGYEIREADPLRKSFIRKAYAVDAEGRTVDLRVIWRKRNGALYQLKEIPLHKLTQATYPVKLDTTTSYYAGAGDGGILGYQTENSPSQALWDELHDWDGSAAGVSGLASATAAFNDAYGVRIIRANSANGLQIGRVFFPIDTSGLGAGASISAATFYAKGYISTGSGSLNIGIVQTSQASTTTLANADFDQCGAVNSPTEGATRAAVTTTNQYWSWALNATGLTWINKTGTTKLGLRNAYDLDDSYPSSSVEFRPTFYFSEETGTTSDPYLEVTYSSGSAYTQDVEEAATANDTLRRDTTKNHEEAVTGNDSVRKGTTRLQTEAATASDSLTTLIVKLQTILEAVTANDSIGKAITKTLEEAAGVADTVIKAITKAFTEAATATASAAATTATYTKALLEAVTANDSISKLVGYARTLTETVNTRDYLLARLNGINAFWSDLYADTADAWSDIYSATTDEWSNLYKDN